MGNVLALLGGMSVGAALTYWLDPQSGRRRRIMVQDKMTHLAREAQDSASVAAKDMSNRLKGVKHEVSGYLSSNQEPPNDEIIINRVRSRIGHVCSHPSAIDVTSTHGKITLYGVILAHEVDRVLSTCAQVRGVQGVDNRMEVRAEPGDELALQGAPRTGGLNLFMQKNPPPAVRMTATGIGAVLLLTGLIKRGFLGWSSTLLGAGLLARGTTNYDFSNLTTMGALRRAIDFQKGLVINASVEDCYNLWSNLELFPRFMSHVHEVKRVGNDLFHWKVSGPGGVSFEWDAQVTQAIPNRVIAWKSVGDSSVPNSGIVRFTPTEDGNTHLDIHLGYNPPGGAMGHAFAKLMGADPKKQMDDDLQRFKSLLESGQTTGFEGRVTADEIAAATKQPAPSSGYTTGYAGQTPYTGGAGQKS